MFDAQLTEGHGRFIEGILLYYCITVSEYFKKPTQFQTLNIIKQN